MLQLITRQTTDLFRRTYADDGDPLDVLVLTTEDIDPLVLVRCYPIGVIVMMDGGKKGRKDYRNTPLTTLRITNTKI